MIQLVRGRCNGNFSIRKFGRTNSAGRPRRKLATLDVSIVWRWLVAAMLRSCLLLLVLTSDAGVACDTASCRHQFCLASEPQLIAVGGCHGRYREHVSGMLWSTTRFDEPPTAEHRRSGLASHRDAISITNQVERRRMGGGKPSVDSIVNLGALAMPACLVQNGGAYKDASPGRTSIDEAAVDGQSGQPRTGRHPGPLGISYCRSPRGRTPEGRHRVWLPTSASLESDSFGRRCRPARLLLRSASAGPSGRRVCANCTLDVTM